MNTSIALAQAQEIKQTDTDTLKKLLADQLKITADTLLYLAQIWQELAIRGVDLSDLRSGLVNYLPKIANGTLDPHLVVSYAGQRLLLEKISKLPIEKQRELAKNGAVTVVKLDSDHNRVEDVVLLSHINTYMVRQVFGNGRIISPAEQYRQLLLATEFLEKNRSKRKKMEKVRAAQRVEVVDDDLYVGASKTSVQRALSALSAHYGFDVETLIEDKIKTDS